MAIDKNHTFPVFSLAESAEHNDVHPVFADPWTDIDSEQERRDNWMLSYIDILTLLLTLFVLLLVLQPKYESPASDGIPELAGLAALIPVEKRPLDMFPGSEQKAGQSGAFEDTTHKVLELELPAEFGLESRTAPLEAEISIENLGSAAFFELESMMPEQQTAQAIIADMNVYPATEAATQVPAKLPDIPAIEPLKKQAQELRSRALDTVMQKLAGHSLNSRLKISQVAEGVHLEVSDKILFAEGSAELKPEGRNLLNELAQVLLQHQGLISVEGHTDNRPIASRQFPSNWELSSGRATTVTRHLIDHGLDAAKMRAVGYADTRPLEPNTTTKGRTRNRRVSLILQMPQAR